MVFAVNIIAYNLNITGNAKYIFGTTLNILSIFGWNMSPTGATPSGSCVNL